MAYRVEIKESAKKELAQLPKSVQRKVARAIDRLAEDPRHRLTEKLTDRGGERRVWAGRQHRILYQIISSTIFISAIQPRKDVYRRR